MKILITGSSGFIGRHLVEALAKEGHEVLGIDKKPWSSPFTKVFRYDHHQVDIRKAALLGSWSIDAVIHLAALTGVRASIENPSDYYETNVIGSVNVLEVARRTGAKRVILASTSSAYGEQPGPWHECMSKQPCSPYAASKVGMEYAAEEWQRRSGIQTMVLRFFTVYGPRGRKDMLIGKALEDVYKGTPIKVYGDGSAKRDWTYVGDTVQGIIAALHCETDQGFTTCNLGGGNPISVNETLETLARVSNCEIKIEHLPAAPGDVATTWADTMLAEELLNWKAKVSLTRGLQMTWNSFLQEMRR